MVGIEFILSQVRDLVEKVGSHYTGTEHLMLTLLADPVGESVLRTYGVNPDQLRMRLQSK
jgi:ATP-dependent Clp protease ATP-binding subunit ClpA